MELSDESKRELLADCTDAELSAALEARKVSAINVVVRDREGNRVDLRFNKAAYSRGFLLTYNDVWYWDQAGVRSLIRGLEENIHNFPEEI